MNWEKLKRSREYPTIKIINCPYSRTKPQFANMTHGTRHHIIRNPKNVFGQTEDSGGGVWVRGVNNIPVKILWDEFVPVDFNRY